MTLRQEIVNARIYVMECQRLQDLDFAPPSTVRALYDLAALLERYFNAKEEWNRHLAAALRNGPSEDRHAHREAIQALEDQISDLVRRP